jgi:SP family myo-inositol transporter-like MFS transporter 13
MLWTAPGMVIGLVLAAVSFHFLTINTGGHLDPNAAYPAAWSGLVLFSMIFYVFSYATGIGNIPWQQSELFPISYVSCPSSDTYILVS